MWKWLKTYLSYHLFGGQENQLESLSFHSTPRLKEEKLKSILVGANNDGQSERDVEMIQRGFKDLDELLSCTEFKDSRRPTKCVEPVTWIYWSGKSPWKDKLINKHLIKNQPKDSSGHVVPALISKPRPPRPSWRKVAVRAGKVWSLVIWRTDVERTESPLSQSCWAWQAGVPVGQCAPGLH